MADSSIEYETADRIGTLTISKPPVHAPTYDDVAALRGELDAIPRADELAVILQSPGTKAFIGGHDLSEFTTTTPALERDGTDTYLAFLEELYELEIPTIAAIDGPALGTGLVVACFCDLRVISPDATLGLPEIDVGAAAGYRAVRRQLPDGVARHLAFTGNTIDGGRAYDLGFASVVSDEPKAAANDLATTIASKSPSAVRAVKDLAIRHQPDWPLADFRRERRRTEGLLVEEAAREAINAFLEDREPEFE